MVVEIRGRAPLIVFALVTTCSLTSFAQSDSRSPAEELVREGEAYAAEGDDAFAARRFVDAIQLNSSLASAYLGLGALRERGGDLREAVATYKMALVHIPDLVPALRGRSRVLRELGEEELAWEDLEHAARITRNPLVMGDAAVAETARGAWPAALATWRLVAAIAEDTGDASTAEIARTQTRALGILCGSLDPARNADGARDWTRRALASMASQRGL